MPGPQPLYQPKFSEEQIAEARDLVGRRQAPHGVVQRSQLDLLLLEYPGIPSPEAARRLGVHPNTIRYWRKRWDTDEFRLEDLPRSGRPPVFSPRTSHVDQGDRLRAASPA